MFKSYAQNFEDIILWRALKRVQNGFYIDIGAQDPVVDSVSRGFYENGWRGIHAEATVHYADLIRLNRPDEEVVQAAIGDREGSLSFFEVPGTGLSTGDSEIAAAHRRAGHAVQETKAQIIPLSQILARAGDRDIHWLKIDVEGMEASVIKSWHPSKARPWIVVVEATEPNSPKPSHHEWENILLGYEYIFAYFDGLSRFYVSEKRPDLLENFGPGPNFFDGFVLSDTSPFVDNSWRDSLITTNKKLEFELRSALDSSRNLEFELRSVLDSRSWRITSPLRKVVSFVNSWRQGVLVSAFPKPDIDPRLICRLAIAHSLMWLKRRPRIAAPLLALLRMFPSVYQYARHLHFRVYASQRAPELHMQPTLLSPRAKAILTDIDHGIDRKK